MQVKIGQFTSAPVPSRFNFAKNAWKSAYNSFLHLKPFLMMSGTLENPFDYDQEYFDYSHFDISFLDYTTSSPNGGIVMDPVNYPTLTSTALASAQNTALNHYTRGFHTLEFMLWGEDLSTTATGARPHYDYSIQPNADRRKIVLGGISALLGTSSNQDGYSSLFEEQVLAADGKVFMAYLFTGMIQFAESSLANEMLYIPYSTGDMQRESSKFSDNSWEDVLSSLEAIEYILNGGDIYAVDSYSLENLFAAVDQNALDKLKSALSSCREKVNISPYDFDYCVANPSARYLIKDVYDQVLIIVEQLKYFAGRLEVNL
jgi:putative iron-regulated protein